MLTSGDDASDEDIDAVVWAVEERAWSDSVAELLTADAVDMGSIVVPDKGKDVVTVNVDVMCVAGEENEEAGEVMDELKCGADDGSGTVTRVSVSVVVAREDAVTCVVEDEIQREEEVDTL